LSGMLELKVDLQLNATHGQQRKPCFRSSRLHEIADPELPFPDLRRFRSRKRIFYAFVIHGIGHVIHGSGQHVARTNRGGTEKFHPFNSAHKREFLELTGPQKLCYYERTNPASRFKFPSCLAGSAAQSISASDRSSRW
jgi:hypothetical protein